jgi:hypothetical protein
LLVKTNLNDVLSPRDDDALNHCSSDRCR